MKKSFVPFVLVVVLLSVQSVSHASLLFTANLNGDQEVPPPVRVTNGSGFGTVVLDDTETMITVNLSWQNLNASALAGHIHGPAPVGVNAGVIFPLPGVTGTSGAVGPLNFPVTPTQVSQLKKHLWYFNIHTPAPAGYPGGEIRGQITPEPSTIVLLLIGGAGFGATWLRKRRAK